MVQFLGLVENRNNSGVGIPLFCGPDSSDHSQTPFECGSKHGKANPCHENHSKGNGNSNSDWDVDDLTRAVVAVPEPGFQGLFLAGLLGLGMVLCLRHLVRTAI